ncbi:DUF6745 domain-containing protein [Couchioplanes caeruleus]|uniref:DUF6745 domain-containing protein n=2 Tax=Couchioplanes caeruleus TaxID=56438 RepID=A0A1K0FAT1_9ACTN|nr:hypothetical protein [Couchioplanes caeruleus]OJF09965.1 hypothetical protein BG844_34765 [Couchioplanes caeruleus subsp. caeruleus]ROP28716.1 hypothetical protein EDD30_1488 [Couchioplanes caeruleus]
MTATARRRGAAALLDHWHRADGVRREWLDVGLGTASADRATAERILSRLYRRLGREGPRFVWVDSPAAALPHTTGIPGHDDLHAWLRPSPPPGRPPVAVDIAASWSRLLAALDEAAGHPDLEAPRQVRKGDKPPPELPPVAALEAGVPLRVVLRRGVRDALRTALMEDVALPVRAALAPPSRLPVCWYGQQDASWIAHHDALRRLGLSQPAPRDAAHLDDWATLARASGWWWPGEEVCVVVERPARIGAGVVVYRDGSRLPAQRVSG